MFSPRISTVFKLVGTAAIGCGLALGSQSCNSKESGTSAAGGSGTEVKLSGAGSTFDTPLFSQWFEDYHKDHSNVTIDYQSVGSGAGIKDFSQGTVDFGASDAAMNDKQIEAVDGKVILLPICAGEVVITYNIDGNPQIKLSRQTLADIYLAKVKKWNDPEIAKDNPDVKLPDEAITAVHRSDGSGTTYCFTNHLSASSPEWESGPNKGTSVNWPGGGIGGKGNEGVTASVKQTPGAIGYVEYGYAMANKLPMAILENKAGKFVAATPDAGATALAQVEFPANLRAFEPDPAGDTSYPIVTFSWMLVKPNYSDAAKGNALKDVIHYALTDGQKTAPKLGYIPMPDVVIAKVQAAADSIKTGG